MCPLKVCNRTRGITYTEELDVSLRNCPISGMSSRLKCPLLSYFLEVAKKVGEGKYRVKGQVFPFYLETRR